jgi:transcriptional regulator with XRE-family HTH domain
MNISDIIRAWRHHHELTIREAAERIGIDRNALYRIEHGESVNQATLFQMWRWMLE